VPKRDLKKELVELYAPSAKDFSTVQVPEMSFLAVDGTGDPNTSERYREAVEALYSVSYAVKFAGKAATDQDYTVMPLEGLWSAADPADFVHRNKARWNWRMMIMQPDWISPDLIDAAVDRVGGKKDLPALTSVQTVRFAEGRSVQILHVGSYDDEGPTLARLHDEYLPAHGLTFNGDHHEIYLSDPRRTDPARLRTVLRQPVRPIVPQV